MRNLRIYIYTILAFGLALPSALGAAGQKRKVAVTVVRPGVFEETVRFPAGVFADRDVVLGAEVPGRVSRLEVEEGDRVERGSRILAIDADTYEAALRAAEADAELAGKEEERGAKLVGDAVISSNDYDALLARRRAADAALDLARINIDKAYMRAPFAGIVDRIMLEDGAYAGVGDPVARILNPETFEVRCAVPEKDIPFINKGAEVAIRHKALGIEKKGKIIFAARSADMESMTFPVKIQGPNTEPMLFSGMIVDVVFVRRRLENVIAVPLFCVMQDSGGAFVYLERGGKAVRSGITVGGINSGLALVVKGLEPGARLISVGQRNLEEGDEVEVAGEN